jgi:hypothetical protein
MVIQEWQEERIVERRRGQERLKRKRGGKLEAPTHDLKI